MNFIIIFQIKQSILLSITLEKKKIDLHEIIKKYNFIDKRSIKNIYTIDPKNSIDLDDAFSINKLSDTITNISIYITNVSIILDYMNLWNQLTDRISTLYLPKNKLVMLPNILSDNICSLLKDNEKFVFTISINIDIINYEILEYNFSNDIIIVSENYRYEEDKLLSNPNYKYLFETILKLNKNVYCLEEIKDSHDIIAYLMILMNYLSSCQLKQYNCGIYKTVLCNKEYNAPTDLPNDIKHFLKIME